MVSAIIREHSRPLGGGDVAMTGAAEWQGGVGDVWATEWRRTERAFAGVGAALDAVVTLHAPASGRALDIGCGVGSTAIALAKASPALTVTGADLSDSLLSVARTRAAGIANLTLVHDDALVVARDHAPLDLFVSRHGVMFFPEPHAAFAALGRAAAPGAPLVFSCFRARADNEWTREVEAALGISAPAATGYAPGPYAFADPDWTGELLTGTCWQAAHPIAVDVAWQVGGSDDPIADATAFFARIGTSARVLADAPPPERTRLESRLRGLLRERCRDDAVTFTAAIWIWTATAGERA